MSTANKLQAIKGMPDILPDAISSWQHVESVIRGIMHSYTYSEIRMPTLEKTSLFSRSIGEVTDIVEKEMYTFLDRNDESLTMRPEGTAGCVRACIEHAMLRNQQQQKLWYMGSMYRYERPQKGRLRQFNQLGVEAFNFIGPEIEAELLRISAQLWEQLGIAGDVRLEINCLGELASRNIYKEQLVEYLQENITKLDEDSKRRLGTNPLRILDSKNPDMQELIAKAPVLLDFIDDKSKNNFLQLQEILNLLGIEYIVNPRLVRGLDYYNGTVFEWTSDKLGAQSAVCAGGRYDNLVTMLGGPDSSAVGFAIGLERLLLLLEPETISYTNAPDCYLICLGERAGQQALRIADVLRKKMPQLAFHQHMGSGNFSNVLKKADKIGAKVALVIGDDEIANDTVTVKFLRGAGKQVTVKIGEIKEVLREI